MGWRSRQNIPRLRRRSRRGTAHREFCRLQDSGKRKARRKERLRNTVKEDNYLETYGGLKECIGVTTYTNQWPTRKI